MGTLLRFGAWRIMIYVKDHGPAHVHVVGPEGRAKIELNCPAGPALPVDIRGMDAVTVRRVVELITDNLARLCAAWKELHGTA